MKRRVIIIAILALAITTALGVYALQPQAAGDTGLPTPDAPPADAAPDIEAGTPEALDTACTVQPAQANDDYWTTSKNTPVTASPIANDPDTPQQNFGGMGQPSHGTTEKVGIDAVKYTPDTGFTGSDSFNYTHIGCLQCFNGWCSEPDFDVGTVFVTVTN